MTKVARILVKGKDGEREISISEFASLRITVRTTLIVERRVRFLNLQGEKIPSIEAIKYISGQAMT